MVRIFNCLLGLAVTVAFATSDVYRLPKADIKKGKDHPLVGRVKGSFLAGYDVKDFDVLKVPLRFNFQNSKVTKIKELEGKIYYLYYAVSSKVTPVAVQRTYFRSLKAKGFKKITGCTPCSKSGVLLFSDLLEKRIISKWSVIGPNSISYLLMKGNYKGKDVNVVLYTYDSGGITHVRLRIIEKEPLRLKLEVVTAEQIKKSLAEKGSVSIYGIYFDHDSYVVKPRSKKALDEIARFLKQNPGVKLYVVGHTDNTGSYKYNLKLSRQRAKAVVDKLVKEYGISPKRLIPVGVGPVAPKDTNKTEEGRAKNRRVELVEM